MKTLRINLIGSLLCLLAASVAVTTLMLILQPNTGISIWPLVRETRGLVFLLNGLPVLLVMCALFFLTGRLVVACGVTGFVFILLSVVNRYMIALRLAPLRPFDLLLGMEFLGIAKSLHPIIFITAGAGALLFVLAFALCLRWVQNDKPRPPIRWLGFALSVGLALTLNFTVYASPRLYAYLPHRGYAYNENDQYQSKGFAYSFLYALNSQRITKPGAYDHYRPAIEEAENAPRAYTPPDGPLPNVVMILSEAFSEIPMSPAINFDGFTDPLRHYKTLKEASVSGFILVPHTGGGTADTEFDILTGLNKRLFPSVPYAFSMVTRPFPSFASALSAAGYATLGLHPGAGWFYNRQNVYPLLGFDRFYDDRTYDTADTKGLYITESQTIRRIIDEYAAHMNENPEVPLFLDCITIQNHGPYEGKYGASVNFNTDLPLTPEEKLILANYFEGIADCDQGLADLTEYFSSLSAPTVLVYYGDHLPSFSLGLYQALLPAAEDDPPGESLLRYNRTPFVIWANDAARDLLDARAFEASLSADRTISAQYLGAAVLEMLGLNGIDPLMDYINGMRAAYPIVLDQIARPRDGEMQVYDPEAMPSLALYYSWAYYRIMNAER